MKKILLILLFLPIVGFGQLTMMYDAYFEQILINLRYDSGAISINEHSANNELLKVTDLLGREIKQKNQPLFYIYVDGTLDKKIII